MKKDEKGLLQSWFGMVDDCALVCGLVGLAASRVLMTTPCLDTYQTTHQREMVPASGVAGTFFNLMFLRLPTMTELD